MPSKGPAERLRQASIRATPQRTAVLHVLEQHPHSDAGFIARAVREKIGTVSRQAVYDALAVLCKAGLVRRFEPAGSPALFELHAGDNHHHAVCHACGAVADVDCAVGKPPCLTLSETHAFVVHEAEVVYWGVCLSCTGTADSLDVT